jgi:2-isopropylmalate synthase
LRELTGLSRFVAEVANLKHDDHHPYTGHSAFAHKGGIHVAAILKASDTYQHIDPELVGNEMRSVISELSGRGNILFRPRAWASTWTGKTPRRCSARSSTWSTKASPSRPPRPASNCCSSACSRATNGPFELVDYFVITERRHGRGLVAEATVKVKVGEVKFTAAEGNGPVNALASALQEALVDAYPVLRTVRLSDYKVRILNSATGTAANTRVLIDFQSGGESWTTVGASTNIIDASWRALADSMEYALVRLGDEGNGGA